MRIAIVTENFLPKVDGVTRTLTHLLEYLEAQHHQIIVLGPASNLDTYAGAQLFGTTGLPFPPYPELKLNLWRPEFTRQLIRFRPHVIHLVDPVFLCAAALFTIFKLNKATLSHIPIVASYHTNLASYCIQFGYGSWVAGLMWKWNRFCHSQCRYTVCPSPSTKQELESRGFRNLRLWSRGIDTQLFTPSRRSQTLRRQWLSPGQQRNQLATNADNSMLKQEEEEEEEEEDKVIILYVGRVSYEKNLRLLVDSYKEMDHQQCHLVIVGNGPALKDIKRECCQCNIPVTFTGYLYGLDVATAYASADIFAFPSFTETFGQVILESMASGLPVVGLFAEGVKDLVTDQETGYLLDVSDLPNVSISSGLSNSVNVQSKPTHVQKYRQLITKLVVDPKTRTALGEKAIERARTFTWSRSMEMMVQVYRDAVSESVIDLPAAEKMEKRTLKENDLGRVTRIVIDQDLNSRKEQVHYVEMVSESSVY